MSATAIAPAELASALADLRDVHLPGAVPWWPLAHGWWYALALALATIAVLAVVTARRRRTPTRAALAELRALRDANGPARSPLALAVTLGALMRRTALSLGERRAVAHLSGDAWGAWLASGDGAMDERLARYIAAAPYVAPERAARDPITAPPAPDELFRATERRLRGHR